MTDNSQRPKGQDRILSALNMAVDGLNVVEGGTVATPVSPVFRSVVVLLTMIRVSSFLSRGETFQAHTWSGHNGQRTGLCRTWVVLRRYL